MIEEFYVEKREFRNYIKSKLRTQGYQVQKSSFYKLIDKDYLVGFELHPSSYGKGYYLHFGVLFLPDEKKWPFCGLFDHQMQLVFPNCLNEEIDTLSFPNPPAWGRCCLYDEFSASQLDEILQLNYEHFIAPRLNKDYVLSLYRNNWKMMSWMNPSGIKKICGLIGADPYEVAEFLDRNLDD